MATAADRFNINSQLEHLQSRYVGTGHADTNRFEWAVNIPLHEPHVGQTFASYSSNFFFVRWPSLYWATA